jgi:hypothetical protein
MFTAKWQTYQSPLQTLLLLLPNRRYESRIHSIAHNFLIVRNHHNEDKHAEFVWVDFVEVLAMRPPSAGPLQVHVDGSVI